jgi:hypothetical protein
VASIVLSIVSVAIAIAAVRYARASAREARLANEFPIFLELLRDYRELEPDRKYVFTQLASDCPDASIGIRGLPPEIHDKVVGISHFPDQLGLLVQRDLANPDSIAGFIGGSILRMWAAIGPFIYAEAKLRDESYQRYFEDLAERVRAGTDKRKRSYKVLRRLDPSSPALAPYRQTETPQLEPDSDAQVRGQHARVTARA